MKVYRASYILESHWKYDIIGIFDFKQEEHEDYEKREHGYFRRESWFTTKLENKTTAYDEYCLAISEKYFERELSKKELEGLKREMQLECIEALKRKKKATVASLDRQIEYIEKQLNNK